MQFMRPSLRGASKQGLEGAGGQPRRETGEALGGRKSLCDGDKGQRGPGTFEKRGRQVGGLDRERTRECGPAELLRPRRQVCILFKMQ